MDLYQGRFEIPRSFGILNGGDILIRGPVLEQVVQRNAVMGRWQCTGDFAVAVHHRTVQFRCLGTPPDEDGSAALQKKGTVYLIDQCPACVVAATSDAVAGDSPWRPAFHWRRQTGRGSSRRVAG